MRCCSVLGAGCSVLGKAATVGGKQSTGGCNSLQINPSRGEFRRRVVSLSISAMRVDGASGAWDRTWSPGKMGKFLLGNKRIAFWEGLGQKVGKNQRWWQAFETWREERIHGTHRKHRRQGGKRIGRRARPRKIVPPSTPARLLVGEEDPNTMPPAPRCLLLGHGAQLDRPLGMSTRDWLPPNLHRAPDVDVVDLFFFLPVHPEQDPHHPSLPRASTTSPPTEKPGMMDAKSRRAPGPKAVYMSSS